MLKRMRARTPEIGIPPMKVDGEGNDAVWLTKKSMRYLQRELGEQSAYSRGENEESP